MPIGVQGGGFLNKIRTLADSVDYFTDKYLRKSLDFSLPLCYTAYKPGAKLRAAWRNINSMKKLLLIVLAVACILACLTVGAMAEETGTGDSAPGGDVTEAGGASDAGSTTGSDGTAGDAPASDAGGTQTTAGKISSVKTLVFKFFEKVASAFWRLRTYYGNAVRHFGKFERFMPIVLSALILVFCFFGYRLFRIETVLLGAVTGYAIAYAAYDFLLAWQGHWAFLDSWEKVLRWVLVGVCAILGMFLGRLFRRIGVSFVLALLVAAYCARYTSNAWVLAAAFAVVMLIGIVAIKPVVIFVTGVGGSVLVVRLIMNFFFGAGGYFPMDLNARLGISPAVNIVLILGTLFGLICMWIQARTSRGRRYY